MLKDLEADVILTNGTIITIDPGRPRAEAVALKHGRILAVGSAQDVRSLKGPRTETIELEGKTVIPGFNDAHNHMASFGMQLQMVSLQSAEAATVDDMVRAESLFDIGGAEGESFFGLSQGIRTGWGDERLRVGPIKMFSDGSLIGRTAAITQGYATEPNNTGFFATPEETLRDWILRGHQSGWQIAIHAIGDRAVSFILDCYEEANHAYPRPDHRHRIEHCGVINPVLLERIEQLGVIPVPQQRFIGELGDGFKRSLGPDRTRWCYVQKSFLERNIPMPGSSDRYVVEGAPLLGIHNAVNQKTLSGDDFVPEERITPEEAIRAYEPGKLADLTVLGADPTLVPPEEIRDIPVQGTLVGGRLLFAKDL